MPVETEATALWRESWRDPRTLLAHPRNPRTHTPEQVEQVRASIRQYGFTNPALITQDGRLIAGHCRTLAAEAEGMNAIPVRVRDANHPLTDAQELALVVADNKLALNAGWDWNALTNILKDISTDGFDLQLTGFDELELRNLIGELDASVKPEHKALAEQEPVDGDMWPVVQVKCPREVKDKWESLVVVKAEEPWRIFNDMMDRFVGTGS